MGLFRKWFGPDNAIVLRLEDPCEPFEEQIREVRDYYTFVKLGQMGKMLAEGVSTAGHAAVTIANARKSSFQDVLPFLVAEAVPFTLFLRPDCIGLNKLPLEEELIVYFDAYADQLQQESLVEWTETAWRDPAAAEAFLLACRRNIGPLPVDRLESGRFFSTWGKITQLPPELRELGLSVHTCSSASLRESIDFLRTQTREPIVSADCRRTGDVAPLLMSLGITCLVVGETGIVTRTTDRWRIPTWDFAKDTSPSR